MLKLNRKGKLARFYLLIGDRDLPDDLCMFWWGLVWRAVKSVVAVAIILWMIGMFGYALFIMARAGWQHPRLAGVIAVGLAVVGLAIWKRRAFRFEFVDEVAEVVQAKVLATKQRFCPRIDWQGE